MIDTGMILVTLNTIGEAVLIETLKEAAYYWQHTNGHSNGKKMNEAKESFLFVSGTGLEIIVAYYHLGYHAQTMKDQFLTMLGVRRTA